MFLFMLVAMLSSCRHNAYNPPAHPLFTQLSSQQTGINFINQTTPTAQLNIFNYRNFYNGGGVAIGDVNNDGWADIFLVSNQGENKLYLNKGNWHFVDVTKEAGLSAHKAWSSGVAMVDINGDGRLDIYISNSGPYPGAARANQLFINMGNDKNGVPIFKEEAAKYGLADEGMTTQAAFFDYDGDGDLDCFMLNNTLFPSNNMGYKNLRDIIDTVSGQRLYRNDNGHFVNVSQQAHIHSSPIGFGLGVTLGDINGDMWPDIYVSNDFYERDYLYMNNGDGTFKDVTNDEIGHISETSMGVDMGDINDDGLPDIFSTDMLPEGDYRLKTITRFDNYDMANAKMKNNEYNHQFTRNMLQLNNGDNTFSEIGRLAGVEATDWTWGGLIFDFDNDGWKDLFVANGIYKDITDQDFIDYLANDETKRAVESSGHFDYKQFLDKIPSTPISNYGFVNQHDLQFKNESYQLGLGMPGFSNGAAYGDLDNDGDLDLVVNNENMPCFIYRNNENEIYHNSYLRVKLKGVGMNTFGIGAKVTAYIHGRQIMQEEFPQRGYESSMDYTLVLGLGKAKVIDSLIVIWPDKKHEMQVLKNVPVNQTITLYQKNAHLFFVYHPPQYHTWYENVTDKAFIGNARHVEDNYNDFDRERLMPEMLSTEGPKIAKADINGDGLEDIFIGGAKNDPGKIFIQQPDGKFVRMDEPALDNDKAYEDIGAAFFDANGDGYPDLMVASGGNEEQPGSPLLMPRLYLNDGKGHFTRALYSIPANISTNSSCLRACDLMGDGRMYVFIGGRDIPGIYGATPKSYLLRDDGKGHFTDVTNQIAPGLQKIGMVTDACWADVDGDGKKDLVVVGEWMPITIFRNTGKKLIKWEVVPNSSGWWNCIRAADLDGDGDMDFVVGNLGLNSQFKADSAHPVQLYVNDFDKNGQVESVLTYYKNDGIAYPMNLKGDMVMQMPILQKKFLKYSDYAGKTIQQIFTPDQLKNALVKNAEYMQTAVLINDGHGKFTLHALPLRAQFSPVFGILIKDLDGDGKMDIFLGGNFYSVQPQIGRYDADYGCFLKGDGHDHFTFVPPSKTGLFMTGEVRDITDINGKNNNNYILVARNNDTALLFKKVLPPFNPEK
jgi:enediyne biosynthesis protein E4